MILSWPIALAITALLGIVGISYYQTVHAYPTGGGAYTVAKENNETAWLLKLALLYGRRDWRGRFRIVTDVPFHLSR